METGYTVMQQNNSPADYVRDGPIHGHISDFGIELHAPQHMLGIR